MTVSKQTDRLTPQALNVWKKEVQSLQELLDLLQSLTSGISDVLTDDVSDEKVPANNVLNFRTLNSRRAASSLVRLVERGKRWKAPDHSQGVLPQNWGETELNHSVTCMVLKATDNDRRHLAFCNDEFRGP
ncbi:uncharacterized protein TNCV_2556061 [Trichonephila clavipes]|nr:uncharacterized protein TNCV_2556061 [Trichonephila clavipes]